MVISKPVGVPAEINPHNRLTDYSATSGPESESIKLDIDRRIDIEGCYKPRHSAGHINQRAGAQIYMVKIEWLGSVVVRDQFCVFAHEVTVILIFAVLQDAEAS